jgi:hypothetical protein
VKGTASSGVENKGLSIVEGSNISKTEEKPTSSVSVRRAGVGAPTTPGVTAQRGKEKKSKKTFG